DIGADQDGLNNIDPLSNSPDHDGADDGVVFPLNLPHCRWTTFNYLVNVTNPGTDLWVNVWFDWNRDGDWDDTLSCPTGPAPEWAVQNQLLFGLPPGLQQLTTQAFMSWHPQFGSKQIWMRITLSEQPWTGGSNHGTKGSGGSGPATGYQIGETEDYYFVPDTSFTPCDSMCQDINGDGMTNIDDLTAFVAAWLASCP
ncbi:MAG: GEVED domain-containing protein, partial [Planctomycetota bacterium]